MADTNKVYFPPEIEDVLFPDSGGVATSASQSSSDKSVSTPTTIKDASLPENRIASEVIASSFNTQSKMILGTFLFGLMGAIQIGEYVDGTSGDLRITPNGIIARNSDGETTFAIDGTTGDATFAGTVAASQIITGTMTSQVITFAVVDGAGDSKIQAGKTDFGDTAAGFILGIDDSDGNKAKLEIGNDTNYLRWNGSTLTVVGTVTATTVVSSWVYTGSLTANQIAGLYLSIGSGNNIFKADNDGLYLGNATFGSAPFRVNMSGEVVAKSIYLTGTVDTDSGGAFKTSSGNSRLEFSNTDVLSFYNGGTLKGRIRGGYNSGIVADVGSFVTKADEGFYACVDNSYTDFFKFYAKDMGGSIGKAGVIELVSNNKAFLVDSANNSVQTWGSTGGYWWNNWTNIIGKLMLGSGTDHYIKRSISGSGDGATYGNNLEYHTDSGANHEFYQSTTIKGIIDENIWTNGDLQANGSKPFIIDHPDGSDRLLRYTAIETPEVLLKTRGVATMIDGKVTVIVPTHFTLVTESTGDVTVQLTLLGDCKGVYATEVANSGFTIKELQGGTSNVKVMWEITAIRKGYLMAPVELSRKDFIENKLSVRVYPESKFISMLNEYKIKKELLKKST